MARKKDPKVLSSLLCRCGKPLPEVAIEHEDPFCSVVCCREWYGVELPPTETDIKRQKQAEAKREAERIKAEKRKEEALEPAVK